MNNRGQAVFYTLMLGIVVVVVALAFAPALKQFTDNARQPNSATAIGLDCSNSSISDFQKAQCAITDVSLPYFILGLVAVAGMIIGAKLYFGGQQ